MGVAGEACYYQTTIAVDAPQTLRRRDLINHTIFDGDVAGHEALGVGGAAQFRGRRLSGIRDVAERVSASEELGEAQPQAEHRIFLG